VKGGRRGGRRKEEGGRRREEGGGRREEGPEEFEGDLIFDIDEFLLQRKVARNVFLRGNRRKLKKLKRNPRRGAIQDHVKKMQNFIEKYDADLKSKNRQYVPPPSLFPLPFPFPFPFPSLPPPDPSHP
jgi:hypothetical protein